MNRFHIHRDEPKLARTDGYCSLLIAAEPTVSKWVCLKWTLIDSPGSFAL